LCRTYWPKAFDPTPGQAFRRASANAAESERLTAIIRRAQWGSHSILAMVLIAAYMGTAKPW